MVMILWLIIIIIKKNNKKKYIYFFFSFSFLFIFLAGCWPGGGARWPGGPPGLNNGRGNTDKRKPFLWVYKTTTTLK